MTSSGRPFAVERSGQRIAAIEWMGPDPTIVLTHGAGLCAGVYEPLAGELSNRCRVVAIDGRGHGHSSRPADDDSAYTLEEQAADVVAVLDALGVESAVGFGHSYGGAVLLEVVLSHPGRVRALAVHEPAVAFDPPERAAARAEGFTRKIVERPSSWPSLDALRDDLSSWSTFGEMAPPFLEAFLRWGVEDGARGGVTLRCAPEVEARLFRLTFSNALLERLPALANDPIPLTIAFGRDGERRRALFEHVAATVGRTLTEVPGSHFAPFSDVGRLGAFVDRHVLTHSGMVDV